MVQKMGDHFSICLLNQGVAMTLQPFLEDEVVFNDAIVHDRDVALNISVRM